MSETNAKSGKMKGVIGFVLSLVSIVLGGWVISALWAAAGFSTELVLLDYYFQLVQ